MKRRAFLESVGLVFAAGALAVACVRDELELLDSPRRGRPRQLELPHDIKWGASLQLFRGDSLTITLKGFSAVFVRCNGRVRRRIADQNGQIFVYAKRTLKIEVANDYSTLQPGFGV